LQRRDGVKKLLPPFGSYLNLLEVANAGNFLEKGSFLGDGLKQGDREGRKGYFERQAWETSAAANVEQGTFQRPAPGDEQAFGEMAPHAFFWIANGREVDFLVPAEEQIQIGKGLSRLEGREVEAVGFDQLAEARFTEHIGGL
jgi:hypothetical protein